VSEPAALQHAELAAALARGVGFVAGRGGELERARAEACADAKRAPALASLLEARLGAEAKSDPAAALGILAALDDARALGVPLAERTCRALGAAQAADGSWARAPGEPAAARLVLTGMLAGHLAKTRFARPERLERAADFLAAHFAPDLVGGGAWDALAACAHCFANVPHEQGDAILQWCGRELERGYRTRAFDAVRAGRVLVLCDAGAIPGARLDARELAREVLAAQQSDGGWLDPADPTPQARVAHALAALSVLARWGGDVALPG
jgi:hypothetical protein